MNKQILATFTILLFALAITGYTYSHWQEILNIQGAIETAKIQIIIQDYNITLTTLTPEMLPNNHTLKLNGTITPSQTLWTGIIIKNNGTTPTTITMSITTNDTNTEKYFTNQTHYYGPYTQTHDISTVWDKATTMPPSGGSTTPPELPAENILIVWQNITLNDNPPNFTIEITVTYTATWQGWTDAISIIYTLTYQQGET